MSTKAYEHQEGQPEPSPEFLTQERPAHEFDVVILGSGNINPFFRDIGGSRTAMYPQFKATTQHGGCGVICEVHPETKIPDFKLSDIPGVRHAD